MIRMGRSSKNENTNNETSGLQEQPDTTAFQRPNETQTASNHAISESESMARDIKEGRLSGFVGCGTVLTGETNFNSMLRVDGHLTGRVSSEEGTLIVGATGQVDANVDVAAAMVNGMINGDIVASEKLELGRTARVVGNISSPRLLVADGAILEGTCSMIKSKEDKEQRTIEQKAQFTTSDLSSETYDGDAINQEVEVENDDFDAVSKADLEEDDEDQETADAATI